MKKALYYFITVLVLPLAIVFTAFDPPQDQYIIIAWNDLGMHCSGQNYENLCILPPYNNLKGHVILRGDANNLPQVVTDGLTVTYEIPGNTYSVGKTNFWTYAYDLFGVELPPDTGLTGVGLTGVFQADSNVFQVEGIPITPYTDENLVTEDPYQLALIQAFDLWDNLLATTQPVIPVSNEMNCVSSGCHASETAILNQHSDDGGFDPNNTPILCADCHSSNALGMPGTPGLPSLSEAVHSKHGGVTNNCYLCHPGPNTQCFRDIMYSHGMVCQDCHGSVTEVGHSIDEGREPWLDEPSCGSANCHGSNFAEEPGKLFRNSRGHGNLYCSACHGSPHAIVPTVNERDNVQNIAIQGFAGTLRDCSVCHGVNPTGPGPHGLLANVPDSLFLQNLTVLDGQTECYNATQTIISAGGGTSFTIGNGGTAHMISGNNIFLLPGTLISSGGYLLAEITTSGQYCIVPPGAMAPAGSVDIDDKLQSDMSSAGFSIHPENDTGIFILEFEAEAPVQDCYIVVSDPKGSQVIKEELKNVRNYRIDLTGKLPGIYTIRVIRDQHSDMKKIMKK